MSTTPPLQQAAIDSGIPIQETCDTIEEVCVDDLINEISEGVMVDTNRTDTRITLIHLHAHDE